MSVTPCIDRGQTKPTYGSGYYNGKYTSLHRCKYVKHHNLSWEAVAGLEVLHSCDNPRCINVEHLSLGTRSDNVRDCVSKGRNANNLRNFDQVENRRRGTEQINSRWSDEDIREMRLAYSTGCTQVAIARRFNCRQSDVSKIVRRQAWAHVT